jgi:hypothetical protein
MDVETAGGKDAVLYQEQSVRQDIFKRARRGSEGYVIPEITAGDRERMLRDTLTDADETDEEAMLSDWHSEHEAYDAQTNFVSLPQDSGTYDKSGAIVDLSASEIKSSRLSARAYGDLPGERDAGLYMSSEDSDLEPLSSLIRRRGISKPGNKK